MFIVVLILLVAIIIVVSKTSKESYFSIDPIDTGVERPLWGKLYALPRRDRKRYMTMHSTPWCVDPLKEEQRCAQSWLSARCSPDAAPGWDCGPDIAYEHDKI